MEKKGFAFLVTFCLFLISLAGGQELSELYYQMDFEEIIQKLEKTPLDSLTADQQRLLIESQARTGNGHLVLKSLLQLMSENPYDDQILTTAGILYHSLGNLQQADAFLTSALRINPENSDALLAKAMLLLYFRRFAEAEEYFQRAGEVNPPLKQTQLYRLIGSELYSASLDPSKIIRYFEFLRNYYSSVNDIKRSRKYEGKIRLLAGIRDRSLYLVNTRSDRVEMAMVNFAPNVFYKCLILKNGNKSYKILLDTGNAVGWTVHNPELLTLLENRFGGMQNTSTGSLEKSFQSAEILTSSLDLGDFKIVNLLGNYFKKPRENYFDANLNPIFIRNRVVTLDFIHNKFLLRSKERFDRELSEESAQTVVKLPFYGYEWPFIPVLVNGYAAALAMIETGAEDVSMKEEFARFIHLPMNPAVKIWGNKKLAYFEASEVGIQMGTFLLYRTKLEIWPKRFYDRITGLYDQVMIGPFALESKFIISFDPFENMVVLQTPIPIPE